MLPQINEKAGNRKNEQSQRNQIKAGVGAENIVGDAQNKCENEVDCAAGGYDQSQH